MLRQMQLNSLRKCHRKWQKIMRLNCYGKSETTDTVVGSGDLVIIIKGTGYGKKYSGDHPQKGMDYGLWVMYSISL